MAEPPAQSPADTTSEKYTRTLYTARVENIGGTAGEVRVENGPTIPTGGPSPDATGSNPEQFLAMAWSTCLGETLKAVLREQRIDAATHVHVEVGLHRDPAGGFRFAPRALVAIEDLPEDEVRRLAEAAHARCPVSRLLSRADSGVLEVVPPPGT
ncbi:organic hydroperoxide resistance protein [Brachybacterium endophyticum]|uniref:Organic hydroperoxide resistance protein n=1 Tax=Brachybacterium endophyticum TaxID=2182385 RepID=A0A2U2RKB8_9MICO|nr:OsmC family protein [Brachybacterium endophyticum]PWH06286.1 organic hydroperoxide resistance protein [Brachybacterium endophyticum]